MHLPRARLRLEELEPRELLDINAFPNTSNGIFILSDQLNGGLSNQLVQFIASHYVGTEKMLPNENARYVADNPNWVLLDYRLATASGPALFIHNGQWTTDWPDVTVNEDWFMHNDAGQRLHNSTFDWYLHDITNPNFLQYWVDSVIADMRLNGAQGIMADSFNAGIGGFWFDQFDARFAGTNAANPAAWPGGYTWIDQQQDLINYVEAALANTPEGFQYIPNIDALVTGWDHLDTSHLDGAFLEGFGEWGPSYLHGASSDWVLSMNRALTMSDAGKILIMQPYMLDTPDSTVGQLQRGFDLGTYLLLKGDHTYLNLSGPDASPTGAYYFPEYGINLGTAVTPLATNVSQYQWNGVYRRDFQNGIVLVNPTDQPVTVDMGQTYMMATGVGGGALTAASLDGNGNYIGGTLITTAVQTLTLVPGSGAILLSAGSGPVPPRSGLHPPAGGGGGATAPAPSPGAIGHSGATTLDPGLATATAAAFPKQPVANLGSSDMALIGGDTTAPDVLTVAATAANQLNLSWSACVTGLVSPAPGDDGTTVGDGLYADAGLVAGPAVL
jgi:hypothetical protein